MIALDLFCGAGGAALGLRAAGWEVVGVDSDPRCAAAYPGDFVRADVFGATVRRLLRLRWGLIWASPPCQRWASPTALTRTADGGHRPSSKPDLVDATRRLIGSAGANATCIENVPRAPLRVSLALTGPMAGLRNLYRLRHFELVGFPPTPHPLPTRGIRPAGSVAEGSLVSVTTQGGIPCRATRAKRARLRPDLQSSRFRRADCLAAMGLPPECRWTMRQIGEAVPPAYAEIVGRLALGQWPFPPEGFHLPRGRS